MAARHFSQRDFSGGEISSRMLARADTDVYKKSVLTMLNFMPTLQGTVERTPGTRFVLDTDEPYARIIPYLSPANERSLVLLSEGAIELFSNITGYTSAGASGSPSITYKKPILPNGSLNAGPEPWVMDPVHYTSVNGDNLGLVWDWRGQIRGTCRLWTHAKDKTYCRITNQAEVEEPTGYITVNYSMRYVDNFTSIESGYEAYIKVGTTAGASDVWLFAFSGQPGTTQAGVAEVEMPPDATWGNTDGTGTLYITVEWIAKATTAEKYSTPQFELDYLDILADATVDIGSDTVTAPVVPYTAADLEDIHVVQSPYGTDPSDVLGPTKPLVFVHPNHKPHWLFWNLDAARVDPNDGVTLLPIGYVFIPMEFTHQPSSWTTGNYPAAVTSFQGRLVFGGSQSKPTVGSPTGPNSETCWATKVGQWDTFTDPGATELFPDDSLTFTTTYRSPIQWLYGQKELLVGALEMEYSVQGDSKILQPGDIGAIMQSTHGSNNVQPVGFGQTVLFPAEGGTKCRAIRLNRDDEGWISPDLTLLNPELLTTTIKRMVRMRNPHQMMIALMGNGQLALLHQDSYAQIAGWSRIGLNAAITDICVVADEDGLDILYLLVQRNINGTKKLYLEAIAGWTDANTWDYMASSVLFNAPAGVTNVITGLDHLEGQLVQVVADSDYLGTFEVEGGEITLEDQVGNAINVSQAVIGLAMESRLLLLPPDSSDPGSAKRFTDVNVRARLSTRPIINGERPSDRSPRMIMGRSEYLVLIEDIQVANLGFDKYQTITIEENIPLRCEILEVYGKLQENSL